MFAHFAVTDETVHSLTGVSVGPQASSPHSQRLESADKQHAPGEIAVQVVSGYPEPAVTVHAQEPVDPVHATSLQVHVPLSAHVLSAQQKAAAEYCDALHSVSFGVSLTVH